MERIINYTREHAVGLTLSLIGIAVILVFAYFIYDTVAHSGKVKVIISAVPSDMKIVIDNKPASPGVLYLEPKKYTVVASKLGYRKYSEDIYLEQSQNIFNLPISLIAESEQAKKEADNNFEEYLKNEGLAGAQADKEGRLFREINPIVSKLPYKNYIYSIGYRADKSDPSGMSIIIEISTSEGNRANAVSQIERWGYDPTKLKIQFRDYRNPFNEV